VEYQSVAGSQSECEVATKFYLHMVVRRGGWKRRGVWKPLELGVLGFVFT